MIDEEKFCMRNSFRRKDYQKEEEQEEVWIARMQELIQGRFTEARVLRCGGPGWPRGEDQMVSQWKNS
jgi:hypothetical protein